MMYAAYLANGNKKYSPFAIMWDKKNGLWSGNLGMVFFQFLIMITFTLLI